MTTKMKPTEKVLGVNGQLIDGLRVVRKSDTFYEVSDTCRILGYIVSFGAPLNGSGWKMFYVFGEDFYVLEDAVREFGSKIRDISRFEAGVQS